MLEVKRKVLMIVEQCNPLWASVPLVGFRFYDEISKLVDVTLITHERNRVAFEGLPGVRKIHYIKESNFLTKYYQLADKLASRGSINWPLYHLLTYPVYGSFNRQVYKQFAAEVRAGKYEVVHAMTPMMPRYPVKMVAACQSVPFVLGPVNGGVPFPKGFEATARKEFAHFNFLRAVGRLLIPGYRQTYLGASKILVGSTYTLGMLQGLFKQVAKSMQLVFENGIDKKFIGQPRKYQANQPLSLLFVGRLVPYKGADMLLEAIARLPQEVRKKVRLTIVGDGSEREALVRQCAENSLSDVVNFTGWVAQDQTSAYYQQADVFCFPSIREFGGAVVLEAMASGLPCVVVNNGGVGEYVSEDNGYKIEPSSREHIVQSMTGLIREFAAHPEALNQKSVAAIARASEFEWEKKGREIVDIYEEVLRSHPKRTPGLEK